MNNQHEWASKASQIWAVIVIQKGQGGRSTIINSSQRGLFEQGATYYNHKLKWFPSGQRLNVTIRLSPKGRRMVQEIRVKS